MTTKFRYQVCEVDNIAILRLGYDPISKFGYHLTTLWLLQKGQYRERPSDIMNCLNTNVHDFWDRFSSVLTFASALSVSRIKIHKANSYLYRQIYRQCLESDPSFLYRYTRRKQICFDCVHALKYLWTILEYLMEAFQHSIANLEECLIQIKGLNFDDNECVI